MTDLATLKLKIDASEVDPAAAGLDRLAAAGKRAEGSTGSAGKEWVRASSAAGKLRMEEFAAAQAAEKMASSVSTAGNAASKMAADAQKAAAGASAMAKSSGLAAHHSQNLVFQLQDIAVGLASGQKPMTVFLQQGAQIQGIMSQAGIGVGGLAKELGGLAVRVAPIAAAAGTAALAMKLFTDNVNRTHQAELDSYAKSLGLTVDEIDKLGGAAVTASDMMLGLWDTIKEALNLQSIFEQLYSWVFDTFAGIAQDAKKNISEIYAAAAATVDGIKAVWGNLGPIMGNAVIAGVNLAIGAIEKLVNQAIDGLNLIAKVANPILAVAKMAGVNTDIGHVSFARISDPFAGAGAKAADAFVSSYKSHLKQAEGAFDGFFERWGEAGVERRNKRLFAGVEKEAEKAGRAAGRAGGKAAADAWEKELAKLFGEAFKPEREQMKALEEIWGDTAKIREQTAALQREADVLHLTGAARQNALILLEQEVELRPLLIRLAEAEAAGETAIADALRQQIAAIEERNAQAIYNNDEIDRINRVNDGLRDTISLLQQIGGLGGVLGGVLGFLNGVQTGDYSMVGGKLGGLLNMVTGTKTVDGKEIAVRFGDELKDVFGLHGQFAATMTSVLQSAGQGAAIGSVTDDVLDKLGIKSNNTGAQLGGAVGMAALGPIGAIGGSILGGIVGGLIGKSHKYGRVTLSDVTGDFDIGGNKGKFKQAATDAGNSIVDALNQIAKELGGVAGAFGDITVGVRDGKWRVNTTGTSLKTGKGAIDFGEDSAAAISYAIQQAVKQGAISGINQSVLNLLQASGDFETQLSKAAELQNIFAEVASAADPMGYELEQLAKKFASVNALLAEANATQEEIDSVANYQAQQEAAIRARYAAEAAAKKAAQDEKEAELLALQGRASEALAKARAAELAQMDAGLAAIQKQIYAETDAATKRALQIQLLEAQGNAWAATQAQRDEVLRTTVDENKALQTRIFLTQDLYDAYKRESDALQDTATKMRGFSDTLRDFRASIFASDNSTTSYTQALAKLIQTGSLAAAGDETALGNLPGVGRDYLDAAKAGAGSLLDYQRAQALVANYTDQAIGFTDAAASQAEQSLALMKEQVGSLISIDDHVVTVAEALERLIALNTPTTASSSSSDSGSNSSESSSSSSAGFNSLKESMEALRRQILSMQRTWTQFSPDGQSMQVVIAP